MTTETNRQGSTETQSEGSHTPEPWRVGEMNHYGRIQIWSGSWHVASISAGLPAGQVEAFAHLIAAAPELLFALKAMVGWQAEVKHAIPLSYLDGAKAAIAKAEGRS